MVKFSRTIGLVAVLTIPQLILAAPAVPPKALGQIEASADFCARVDSPLADKYKEVGKVLVTGMSEKELKEVRESSDYKTAYDAMTGRLEKIPQDKAVASCRASRNIATK
jgi:hypothetical protein